MTETTPSSPDPGERPDPTAGDPTSEARTAEAPTSEVPGPEAPQAGGGGPAPPPPPRPRRFLRSRDDRIIGGVCGGLARYFGIDPLIVRIAAVALAFAGGLSIIAYIAALAFVPQDDGTGNPSGDGPSRTTTIIGAAAIIVAGIVIAGDGWWGVGWLFGPMIPLALVVGILAYAGNRLLRDRGETTPTAGRIAGAALVLLAVIAASCVAFVGAAWATAAGAGAAIAGVVIALGVAMIVLAFRGNARLARWLTLPALVLAIPAGIVSAANVDTQGGIGQRTYRPATSTDLRPQYKLGIGELKVDLRRMEWPADGAVTLKVDVGVGHALVLVPADVCVQSAAHAGLGYVGILGEDSGGADVNADSGTVARTQAHRLVLDGNVGIGALEVLHNDPTGSSRDFGGRDFGPGHGVDNISSSLAAAGCAGNPA